MDFRLAICFRQRIDSGPGAGWRLCCLRLDLCPRSSNTSHERKIRKSPIIAHSPIIAQSFPESPATFRHFQKKNGTNRTVNEQTARISEHFNMGNVIKYVRLTLRRHRMSKRTSPLDLLELRTYSSHQTELRNCNLNASPAPLGHVIPPNFVAVTPAVTEKKIFGGSRGNSSRSGDTRNFATGVTSSDAGDTRVPHTKILDHRRN